MNTEDCKKLSINLLKKHKLSDWKFSLGNASKQFGVCKYKEKTITLSKKLVELNNEEQVVDTILHEIAHALCPKQHHNEVWRQTAISIGCNGQRTYSNEEVVMPDKKYKATCPTCGRIIKRYKKSKISCGKCSRTFDLKHLFVWEKI